MSAEPCERVQISGRVVNCSCIFNLDSSRISNAENQMLSKVEVLFYVVESLFLTWEKLEDYSKLSLQVSLCLFFIRSISYCEVKKQLLFRIETLFQSSLNRVDIVKPFVAAVVITIKQEQYARSYILISSDASPFFKGVRSTNLH